MPWTTKLTSFISVLLFLKPQFFYFSNGNIVNNTFFGEVLGGLNEIKHVKCLTYSRDLEESKLLFCYLCGLKN